MDDMMQNKDPFARRGEARMTTLRRQIAFVLISTCGAVAVGSPQSKTPPSASSHSTVTFSPGEARTARAFEEARARGPVALYAFLYGMPKGGDLHNHLSGAIYAESWIRAAGEDHLCVDVNEHSFIHDTDGAQKSTPDHCDASPGAQAVGGRFPAASLGDNQPLYDALVDAFSMRSFVPVTGESGHDHFFATFDKFSGTSKEHMPEWLDEIASRAAVQNEQYLELMHTPPFVAAAKLAVRRGYSSDFAEYRQKMLDGGLRDEIEPIRSQMDGYLKAQRAMEHCDTSAAEPACGVKIRFIYQVLRNFPPPVVFAQILLGFEVAAADPQHFLAINLVQPEDDFYAMRDYRLHMQMIAALHKFYPQVHVTLHAGELAPGLVPPDGLRFHIHDAVEVAGAERIGHGVDIMYEDNSEDLLHQMAKRHTMVEINLTSNQGILNVSGATSPLPFYLDAGVPVALSTDDEGVNRSNMTHEYTKAASIYGLSYTQLKDVARNSLTYSFLPGESLWPITTSDRMYLAPVDACRSAVTQIDHHRDAAPGSACAHFLENNEKASQQLEMERRFSAFEESQPR
jgi:adenosine deaminase